jgi:DNA-binding LacI/PurR family transcriptional regulator
VLKAIAESNYQPNLLARQLRTARSSMILVLVSNIANPFCAEVVKGIEEEAEKTAFVSCCAIPVRTWRAPARR